MASQPEISSQYTASQEIDRLLDSEQRPRDRLGNLCRAMLAHQGADVSNISNSDAVSHVLSSRSSGRDQRFFAAVFLRLLSVLPNEIHDLDIGKHVGVTKLLAKLPQVSKALSVDRNSQGYERLRALEMAADRADQYLREALTVPTSLAAFDQVYHRVMRLYRNPLVRAISGPFLPDFLSKSAVSAILTTVQKYVAAPPRDTMATYTDAEATLEAVLAECIRYDTRFVTHFYQPFFRALLHRLTTDYKSNPANLPGCLSLTSLGKRYPFSVSDAQLRVAFAVENQGQGIAFDVELTLDPDHYLSFASPSQFFEQVLPGERFAPIEFPAIVDRATDQPVLVVYKLTWRNGNGSARTIEDFLELPTQPSDIPWDELTYTDPYSLEPVRTADDLIGRSEHTRRLISKLRAQSVGSFCISGQRRVGKTSVVFTLAHLPVLKDITILYLETGMFIDPDAQETINRLGNKICRILLERRPMLAGLTTPNFTGALAPLDGFLSTAFVRDPDLRLVVVLDEFDALPPELYRRNKISHAFFLTLRSLSAQQPLGFILVGGERMAEILSTQGEVLNKFRRLQIDYLDSHSHWADFVALVRRPVEAWAQINDDAITKLYEVTAGNPFFTKFVCAELVEDMKRRQDADVTAVEMDRAIKTAVNEASINNFQHFWDDGVVASTDERIDQERALRRRVLVALGEVLRSNRSSTTENIAEKASRFGLSETEVQRMLGEFEKRMVLVQADGQYSCKVGLFERWLVDQGVSELDLSLVEEEHLRRIKEAEERKRIKIGEISTLVNRWENYRGRQITDGDLKSWLDQFANIDEQRMMFELLKKLRFYSGGLIREKLRNGHGFVRRELAGRGVVRRAAGEGARKVTDNILISYYGGEERRGPTYAKIYADENKIYRSRIAAPERLTERLAELIDVAGIVFVDDFIGTGRTAVRTLKDSLSPMAELLKQREVDVFLISVSGFARAARKIKRALSSVIHSFEVSIADPLDDTDKCFADKSAILPDPAKRARAKEIAEKYGKRIVKRSPLGFGNCQALIVFENTCPNNSLPILWGLGADNSWRPLFSRP